MTTLCGLAVLASLLILAGIFWPESPRCRLSHDVPTLPVDPSPSAPAPPLPASTQDALPRGCASYTIPPVAVAALAENFPHENAGTPFFTF